MRLYNDTIMAFLGHAEKLARDILSRECGLSVGRTRFSIGRTTYPLSIVCFEDSTRWGYFESQFYQIGLNAKLAGRVNDAVLRDLLRHELAHYLVFIQHGFEPSPHGAEFKALCARFNWPVEVSEASGDLFSLEKTGDLVADSVIEKVKKLLALASSSNPHEAELATLKANQLILRHHIDRSQLANQRELCVMTLMSAPKKNTMMIAIYDILTHFLVKPVLFYGRGVVRLEAAGTRAQVELAHYICQYLERELEVLWKAESKRLVLKGLRAKNSFFVGIARGFSEKLHHSRTQMPVADSRALVKIETELTQDVAHFMGGLGSSHSGQVLDSTALQSGMAQGRNMNIRPGVQNAGGQKLLPPHKA